MPKTINESLKPSIRYCDIVTPGALAFGLFVSSFTSCFVSLFFSDWIDSQESGVWVSLAAIAFIVGCVLASMAIGFILAALAHCLFMESYIMDESRCDLCRGSGIVLHIGFNAGDGMVLHRKICGKCMDTIRNVCNGVITN